MPAADEISKQVDGLALWLAEREGLSLKDIHVGFCDELVVRGVPLWRSALGLELLHPEQSGVRTIWSANGEVEVAQAPKGLESTPAYLNSPVRIVDETGRPFRQRLTDAMPDLPLLHELKVAGGTDYIIFPLPFLDRPRSSYLSYATASPDGFAGPDFKLLEIATKLISPYAERRALRRMAIDLLDTYVGRYAGARIFDGQILRGAVDTIEAAILMCDLRGFTVMSMQRERDVVIETLNTWFESVAGAVEGRDGEILKFMGDGLLAIFSSGGDVSEACRRAFAAALDAQTAIAAVNEERRPRGAPVIGFAMGLHVGEVAYGNVGGRTRLDFTVLGPAVNYASRLQDLAKRLRQPVLVSREFAEMLKGDVVELGAYPLRGISKAEQVFALPAAAAQAVRACLFARDSVRRSLPGSRPRRAAPPRRARASISPRAFSSAPRPAAPSGEVRDALRSAALGRRPEKRPGDRRRRADSSPPSTGRCPSARSSQQSPSPPKDRADGPDRSRRRTPRPDRSESRLLDEKGQPRGRLLRRPPGKQQA